MKWRTERRKIKDLKNWEDNPRTISEEAFSELISSIDDLGNFEPLVVNVDGTVIAGNQRLKVAQKLGETEVEVSIPERKLTKKEIKKIGVISNRHSGEWDMDKLAEEFEDILEDLGYDDLLPEVVLEVEEDDYEEPEDLEPKCKLGDIYQLGEHRLMCGDSTKIEDVEKLMNGQKADMVFTDPPYGISHSGKGITGSVKGNDFGEILGDGGIEVAVEAYNLCVALDIDSQVWWGANYYCSHLSDGFGWIVWDKEREGDIFSGFEIAYSTMGVKSKIYRHKWHGMIRGSEQGQKTLHPTQKPVKLCIDIFNDFDKQSVLDLFGGSGSTLIACEQTNRKCYMMELDPHYCDVIIDRWEQFTGKEVVKLNSRTNV